MCMQTNGSSSLLADIWLVGILAWPWLYLLFYFEENKKMIYLHWFTLPNPYTCIKHCFFATIVTLHPMSLPSSYYYFLKRVPKILIKAFDVSTKRLTICQIQDNGNGCGSVQFGVVMYATFVVNSSSTIGCAYHSWRGWLHSDALYCDKEIKHVTTLNNH